MKKKDAVKEWEKNKINALTLKMIFAATGGTLAATVVAYFLKHAGMYDVQPEMLFIPWGIALVFGVSMAFHQGVQAERERAGGEAPPKKKS